MILIFATTDRDPTVAHLCDVLHAQGAETVVVSAATMEAPSSFEIAADGGARLRLADRVINLDDVRAAWLWRGWEPYVEDHRFASIVTQPYQWAFFQREWSSFHRGIALTLAYRGIFCVNAPAQEAAFREKSCQLMLAAQLGLQIPPTLYTTRLREAQKFHDRHAGGIIYKPFSAYVHTAQPQQEGAGRVAKLYTTRVQAAELVEHDGFVPTPAIFQPYIPKQFEVRVVIVGRHLFACAIHSQQSPRSREDWRRYDFDNTPYEPYELPASIADKLFTLMEQTGLVFASVDLIVTPRGEHIFLEINPSGQFDWIARLAGLPIYKHLAAMLHTAQVDYDVPAPNEEPYVC